MTRMDPKSIRKTWKKMSRETSILGKEKGFCTKKLEKLDFKLNTKKMGFCEHFWGLFLEGFISGRAVWSGIFFCLLRPHLEDRPLGLTAGPGIP